MTSSAPPPRSALDNQPTLLFSWWCTGFAAVIIVTRLAGRKVRSNKLFREDWIMMAALAPLLLRMGCIHLVLRWGTNNVDTATHPLSPSSIRHRQRGSQLVLVARIAYAAFLWTSKLTISEFLKRMTYLVWRRSYQLTLHAIRLVLLLTFVAVVVSTLVECHPVSHYWQVVPDPGPRCRQAFAQLYTMASCDVLTDVLLIAFPIPLVWRSGRPLRRKCLLTALFALSAVMVVVALLRVPHVVARHGSQQYRTAWASGEILASACVSNAVVIGSFLRDKGLKRNKFRAPVPAVPAVPPNWLPSSSTADGDDEDEGLFRYWGIRVPDDWYGDYDSDWDCDKDIISHAVVEKPVSPPGPLTSHPHHARPPSLHLDLPTPRQFHWPSYADGAPAGLLPSLSSRNSSSLDHLPLPSPPPLPLDLTWPLASTPPLASLTPLHLPPNQYRTTHELQDLGGLLLPLPSSSSSSVATSPTWSARATPPPNHASTRRQTRWWALMRRGRAS